MGIRSRLAKRWGADLIAEAKNEALEETLEQIKGRAHRLTWANPELIHELHEATAEASTSGIDPDDYLYRALSGYWSPKDLTRTYSHDETLQVAYTLWQRNPLGKRIAEMNADYIVGDGITLTFTNPEVEDRVMEFWTDDDNRLDERLPTFALEYGLYGELIPQALVGDTSGIVKLGYVDPYQVARILCLGQGSDTQNVLIDDVVELKRKVGEIGDGKQLQVIRVRESGKLEGEVFLFKANALSNDPRGWPDVVSFADWLDQYDAMLWDMLERHRLMGSFIYDVTIEGDERKIAEEARKFAANPPKKGTVRVHNRETTWTAVSPSLNAKENAIEADVLKEHLAGGSGFPKTWLSGTTDVNRATAQELGTPTVRRLASRQKQFLSGMERMIRFVLEQAETAGRLKGVQSDGTIQVFDEDGKAAKTPAGDNRRVKPWECVKLQGPETSVKDMAAAGQVLQQVIPALAIAEEQGWMGSRPIRQSIQQVMAYLGLEYDPSTDLEPQRKADQGANGSELDPSQPEPSSRRSLDAAAAGANGGGR
jgi:hypothetical protein